MFSFHSGSSILHHNLESQAITFASSSAYVSHIREKKHVFDFCQTVHVYMRSIITELVNRQ